jgi:hypothetical protein
LPILNPKPYTLPTQLEHEYLEKWRFFLSPYIDPKNKIRKSYTIFDNLASEQKIVPLKLAKASSHLAFRV